MQPIASDPVIDNNEILEKENRNQDTNIFDEKRSIQILNICNCRQLPII